MNKQELMRSLERCGHDFLSMYEIAEVLNLNRGTVRQMMHGVSYLPAGRKKLFYKADIAERLMQLREK